MEHNIARLIATAECAGDTPDTVLNLQDILYEPCRPVEKVHARMILELDEFVENEEQAFEHFCNTGRN